MASNRLQQRQTMDLHPTVIPVDAPVVFSAFSAEDDLRKAVITGVAASFAVLGVTNHAPAGKFLLYQQEDVLRDDRFVVALHVILREHSVFACKVKKGCRGSQVTGIAADVLVQHVDLSTVIVSLSEQGIVFFVIDNRINVALTKVITYQLWGLNVQTQVESKNTSSD